MKKLLYLLSLGTLISIPLIKADNKYSFTLHNCDYAYDNSLDWKFTQAGQTTEGTHDNGQDVPATHSEATISPTVMPASTKEWQYPPTLRYDSMKFSTSVNARWFDSTSTEEQNQVPANGDTLYVQLIDNNYTTSITGCPAGHDTPPAGGGNSLVKKHQSKPAKKSDTIAEKTKSPTTQLSTI